MTLDDATNRRTQLSAAKRALLEKRLKGRAIDSSGGHWIPKRATQSPTPLSFAQQRLWFLDTLGLNNSAYNIPNALRLKGRLDVDVLARSFNEIIRRHESLRTTFQMLDEQPAQIIAPSLELSIDIRDLRAVPGAEREGEVVRLLTEEAHRAFDLTRGPLVRAGLLRVSDEEHVLFFNIHHIISDGWSMNVLVRELAACYEAFSTGNKLTLPEIPIQYADFAQWQRAWLTGETLDEQLRYWKRQLGDPVPVLELPTDRPRPAVQDLRGGSQVFELSSHISAALKSLSRHEGATLFMTLLAAFQALLQRVTYQEHIIVGTPIANRTHAELEGLIGFFANTLVLRTDMSGNPTFREALARVREVTLGAYAHQDLPFERLVEELHPVRDLSRTPLCQVILGLHQAPADEVTLHGLTLDAQEAANDTTRFDLELHLIDLPEGIRGDMVYSKALFDETTIVRLLAHFRMMIEGVVADPDKRLSDFELLTEAERQQLLFEFNNTRRTYPHNSSIHQLFEAQAARTPDKIALVSGERSMTYGELNRRANQLARHLRAQGLTRDGRAGICVERSAEMIVGLLGILKAGGAYVPLDASYPPQRLRFMLRDTGAQLILTTEKYTRSLPDKHHVPVILLDADSHIIDSESEHNLDVKVFADNLAYVTYTSGSTGTPKGVGVVHRGVVRLVKENHFARLDRDEVLLQFAPLAFDASTFEIWGSLLNGAQLVLLPPTQTSLKDLGEALDRYRVTTLWLAAGLFHLIVDEQLECVLSLRQLLAGGDVLSVSHVRKFLDAAGSRCKLINGYGPTENTTFTCCHSLDAAMRFDGSVPIGRPIANTEAYVLDAHFRLVPTGFVGELYAGGDGLARGYLDQPALTAAKFIPHPFNDEAGARLYRTGDLARILADGTIEFLGRLDRQVKIRGYRIELGEIEATLGGHPRVRETVVVACEASACEKRVVAYVVADEGQTLTTSEIQDFLKPRLPAYMLPSAVVVLDEIPLTAYGKVARHALRAPDFAMPDENFVAPRTPVEEMLAVSWSALLNVERIGIHDDFFQLGGHSLLLTQLVSRLRHSCGVELSLRSMFEATTIAGQAQHVETALGAGRGAESPPIVAVPRSENQPLSFAQQRLWFLHELEPSTSAYNIPTAVRLHGLLDVDALTRTLREVVTRHESLRTNFGTVDGQPVQIIAPARELHLPLVDLRALPAEEREALALSNATEEARRPFNLSTEALLRVSLMRLDEEEHVLVLTMHHIISDGWSMNVLVSEISKLYEAFREGRPSPLAELPVQYADFAQWQRKWLTGAVLETHLDYWKQQLGGSLPTLDLPTDKPRPEVQSFHGASRAMMYPASLVSALNALCQREGVTLFMLLLAAFKVLLHRYTEQTDIIIGSPIANRNRMEIENLIGFFVNTLVMRTDLSDNPTFIELLRRVRGVALGAYAHQDLPFEQLVERLQPERSLSRNPLFQVMFQLENTPKTDAPLSGLTLSPIEVERVATQFDLSLDAVETEEGLMVVAEYSTDLFDSHTIDELLQRWQILLQAIVENPSQRIARLPLLTEAERRRVLVEWNNTGNEFHSGACVHELFEAQAERTPEAIAIVCDGVRVTYGELNRHANRLANYLRARHVEPEVIVGVLLERSVEMIVGLLGILKAGGAYVPLDASYPPERLRFMLRDTGTRLVVTSRKLAGKVPQYDATIVCLDSDAEDIAQADETFSSREVLAEHPAYVIYTSGSTGMPKGVTITHRALVNHNLAVAKRYELQAMSRVLQFASISFDVAIEELFPTLISGGTVVLRRSNVPEALDELVQLIEREGVSVVNLPAQFWHEWMRELSLSQRRLPESLRLVVVGSEKVSLDGFGLWQNLKRRDVRLVNAYGTSETTITTTLYQVPATLDGQSAGASLPIGRAIDNTEIYILDTHGQLAPIGLPGELHIGGAGLARGYFGRADLTGGKFVPHPFSETPGARLYRTGDQARYRRDGHIEFLGRVDGQVKLRGYRVELGEVEAALALHPSAKETIVLAREDTPGDKRLVAYVTHDAATGLQLPAAQLEAEQLSQWQMVHNDEVFNDDSSNADPSFNISGWNSSYTGLPIPPPEMREWVDETVACILALKPKRVLEIGCGTGLILFRVAPYCESFTGTDFSPAALDYVRQQLSQNEELRARVDLHERHADNLEGLRAGEFDAVILNSVVQYFPNGEYLRRVLQGAVKLVAPGGVVFVGDVRSLPLLEAFSASVELNRAESSLSARQLQGRVRKLVRQEEELVVAPQFFDALRGQLSRISDVEIVPKRSRFPNELTKFRYQVVIRVGDESAAVSKTATEAATEAATTWISWQREGMSLDTLRTLLLEQRPEMIGISGVENARVAQEVSIAEMLAGETCPETVGELRNALATKKNAGVEPEDVRALSQVLPYEVEISWARHERDGRFDVLFRRSDASQTTPRDAGKSLFPMPHGYALPSSDDYTNNPLLGKQARLLTPQLRSFLKERLPDYMIPASFVVLDEWPLMTSGKIDRRALPVPDNVRPELHGAFVAPRTPVEHRLASLWSEVLGVARVGVFDNFFELGGHSLLATQFVSRVREAFKVEMPLRQLFERPTIDGLAPLIEQAGETLKPVATPVIAPLSREAHRMKRPVKNSSAK